MFLHNILLFLSLLPKTKIINTPIFENFNIIKLHNVVLLHDQCINLNTQINYNINENTKQYKNIYIIDYSPIDDITKPDVLLKIILGKNINGKVNIFYFDKIEKKDIINQSYKKIPSKIKLLNKKIYKIIDSWDSSFNLYNHNCRHFSHYFVKSCDTLL